MCLLNLTPEVYGKVVGIDLLLEALEQSKSLKRLSLIKFDSLVDGGISKLLRKLWKIHNVTHLDLSMNHIFKFPVLDASVFVSI
jgi:hypothetical protein